MRIQAGIFGSRLNKIPFFGSRSHDTPLAESCTQTKSIDMLDTVCLTHTIYALMSIIGLMDPELMIFDVTSHFFAESHFLIPLRGVVCVHKQIRQNERK